MSYIKLNGIPFDVDVAISDYEENFNVLDGPNAERSLGGRMIRDIIGAYIGHKITVFRRGDSESAVSGIDRYWDYLIKHSVDNSVLLEAADGQSTISYEAYYTSGGRKLEKVANGINYWDEIAVNFVPMEAQLTPD